MCEWRKIWVLKVKSFKIKNTSMYIQSRDTSCLKFSFPLASAIHIPPFLHKTEPRPTAEGMAQAIPCVSGKSWNAKWKRLKRNTTPQTPNSDKLQLCYIVHLDTLLVIFLVSHHKSSSKCWGISHQFQERERVTEKTDMKRTSCGTKYVMKSVAFNIFGKRKPTRSWKERRFCKLVDSQEGVQPK